jgi:dihydrodipicolinate synthase/N-acetylneuraminate lyase
MSRRPPAEDPVRAQGVIAAAVTPRRSQEYSIDLGATLELIDFLAASGLDGIALLGSTGEFVHFAVDDRRHMVNLAAKRSRVPLLVNVSHSNLEGAVELAREAAASGVAGVLLMPPYYFRYSQETVRSFCLAFAAAVGESTPIYLYNIPSFTTEIAGSTMTELLATGLFAGVKDSSGGLENLRLLAKQARKTPFTLLAGNEKIYVDARGLGAHGTISGVACAAPELMLAYDRAILAGQKERLDRLRALLDEFLEWIEMFPLPAGIKEALKERDVKAGTLATPLGQDEERKLAQFREWFRGWLPGVLRECSDQEAR